MVDAPFEVGESSNGLLSHQLHSYNFFIQKVFDSFGEMVVEPWFDPAKHKYLGWRYASVKFESMTYSSRVKVSVQLHSLPLATRNDLSNLRKRLLKPNTNNLVSREDVSTTLGTSVSQQLNNNEPTHGRINCYAWEHNFLLRWGSQSRNVDNLRVRQYRSWDDIKIAGRVRDQKEHGRSSKNLS
ncbi:unnamed protein product [Arabis nemorensis]|uniref:Uncharacterized protein n=1 Tax=Arabis nemorensis TaxID=586526 RepID=A0A565CHM0_9BRAS|nr:unnamed protein product [Arabis nemorensis]